MVKKTQQQEKQEPGSNTGRQGIDKAPGEEQGKGEQVRPEDLKGKKVDGDPEQESDQPVRQDTAG